MKLIFVTILIATSAVLVLSNPLLSINNDKNGSEKGISLGVQLLGGSISVKSEIKENSGENQKPSKEDSKENATKEIKGSKEEDCSKSNENGQEKSIDGQKNSKEDSKENATRTTCSTTVGKTGKWFETV